MATGAFVTAHQLDSDAGPANARRVGDKTLDPELLAWVVETVRPGEARVDRLRALEGIAA